MPRPVGISLGLIPHISTINSDLIDYSADFNMIFTAGVAVPFGKKLALTSDLTLLHTGATTTNPPDPPNDLIDAVDVRDRFAYLQLAAGLRYYFSDQFYLGGYTGPGLHIYTERLTTTRYSNGFDQEERRRFDFGEGDVRRLNWLANLGIGYELPITDNLGLVLEPNAYISFASIDTRTDLDARAFGFGIRTAIIFKNFRRNINMRSIPEEKKARYIRKMRKAQKENNTNQNPARVNG